MTKTLLERLNSLSLSAAEVKRENPGWSDNLVLDYIAKSEDISMIASELSNASGILPFTNNITPVSIEHALRSILLTPRPSKSNENESILFMQQRTIPKEKSLLTVVARGLETVDHNTVTNVALDEPVDMNNSWVQANPGSGLIQREVSASVSFYAAASFTPSVQLTSPTNVQIVAPDVSLNLSGSGSQTTVPATVPWQVITIKEA